MKTLCSVLCALAVLGFFAVAGNAEEKDKPKEVTLKGTILCAKCALKDAKACTNAIQVKEGDKTVVYLFDDKGLKEDYHDEVCGGDKKEGSVTGVVSEKDGKKYIKPTKVDFAKKK